VGFSDGLGHFDELGIFDPNSLTILFDAKEES
jgi:hypothetical protein